MQLLPRDAEGAHVRSDQTTMRRLGSSLEFLMRSRTLCVDLNAWKCFIATDDRSSQRVVCVAVAPAKGDSNRALSMTSGVL